MIHINASIEKYKYDVMLEQRERKRERECVSVISDYYYEHIPVYYKTESAKLLE